MDVTVIITNFKTLRLVQPCYESLRAFYPGVKVVVIDNGSQDESTKYVANLVQSPSTECILLEKNIGHGPALALGVEKAVTAYFFTLDSDCVVNKGGFLELMLDAFSKDSQLYAIGWLRRVGVNGVASKDTHPSLIPYAHPAYSMYRRDTYSKLPPFAHHGAPALENMREAKRVGYKVLAFPISEYIQHLCAGTRRMYGGRWNPKLGEDPARWDKQSNYPI